MPINVVANIAHRYSLKHSGEGQEVAVPRPAAPPTQHGLITIGYFSGNFHEHPVCAHTSFLFRLHDRSKYRVVAFAYGESDSSECRREAETFADKFVDLTSYRDEQAAAAIAAEGVHVLIELTGLMAENRLVDVLRFRPAPVMAHYLGYSLGTMACSFLDYYITDRVSAPPENNNLFMENVIRMPYAYHFAHSKQAEEPVQKFTRGEFGLPEDAVVFSSFNQAYKIEPDLFNTWMALLRRETGSVLWLAIRGAEARENMLAEVAAAGVDPSRIVFAERMSEQDDHFIRMGLSDVALDSWVYNGHTTTIDLLRAGVPVVTMPSTAHPSRVAASILYASSLGPLVASSAREYEDLAYDVTRDVAMKTDVSDRMSSRFNTPLFDLTQSSRAMEYAIDTMWDSYLQGALQ